MMKKISVVLAVALCAALSQVGCTLDGSVASKIEQALSGMDAKQVVALATNMLHSPIVQEMANAIMSDTNLVATLTNAWNEVQDQYQTPDEVEDGGGAVQPDAGGEASSALPAIGAGKTITGYAPVNFWWNMDYEEIQAGLAAMQASNVRWFCPEAVGNAGEDVLGSPAKMERMKSRFLLTQSECKALGIWFAPILFNGNAGDGAYQNGGVKLEKREAQARAFIDWLAENGDKSVLSITVVSEIQTAAGKRLEAYGLAKLGGAGFRLDYNGSSRPSSKPAGYAGLRVWHVCDVNSWPSKDVVWLSDCGTAIRGDHFGESAELVGPRSLNLNGDLNGMGDPAKIAAKKAEAVARGVYVFAIYGFQNRTFDFAAIKALAMPETPSAPPATTGDLTGVTWLHANVSDWKQTATLDASVSGSGSVTLAYDKAAVWPGIDGLNANPWVIVKWQDGKTYAATWEWLRTGQTSKAMGGKSWGSHIKVSPLSKWEPKSGENVGIMVSGLARDGRRNVKERSNVDWVTWP